MQLITRIQRIFHETSKNLWSPVVPKEYHVEYSDDSLALHADFTCYIKEGVLQYIIPRNVFKHEVRCINKWGEKVWDDYPLNWHTITGIEQELILDELSWQLYNDNIEHERMEVMEI